MLSLYLNRYIHHLILRNYFFIFGGKRCNPNIPFSNKGLFLLRKGIYVYVLTVVRVLTAPWPFLGSSKNCVQVLENKHLDLQHFLLYRMDICPELANPAEILWNWGTQHKRILSPAVP